MTFLSLSNDKISLVPLDETFATEIFNSNGGNVKQYFAKFNNIKDAQNWIKSSLLLINYGVKIETVILSHTKEFVGMIALDGLDNDIADLRLWISEEFQNRGMATLASYLMIDYFNQQFPDKQLKYEAASENVASNALAKKLNFHLARSYREENKKLNVYVLKQTLT